MTHFYVSYDEQVAPDGYQFVDLNNTKLDDAIDDGEALSLIVDDVLCRFPYSEQEAVLRKLHRKIRKGGELCLGFVDANLTVKKLNTRKISEEEFNTLLFDNGRNVSATGVDKVRSHLSALNMNIEVMEHTTDHRFYITAKKG